MAKTASSPFQIVVDNAAGDTITASLYFDTSTGAIQDDATQGAALVAVNNTGGVCPVTLTDNTTQQTFSVNVPKGTTKVTAAQLAARGYTSVNQVSFGVSVPAGA